MFDIDLSQALVNSSRIFDAIRATLYAIAALVGFVIFAKGIKYCIEISRTNGPSQVTPSKAVWHLFFGAFFAAFAWTISAPWESITESDGNTSIVSYDVPGMEAVPDLYKKVITAALSFIQLVGYGFAFYGLLVLLKASYGESGGGGESPTMKGFWHFGAGIAAINIGPVLMAFSQLVTAGQ